MLKVTFRLLFLCSLLLLAVSLWTFTIGQRVSYEFRDTKIASDFYYYLFTWTPVAFVLTLFGTIKKEHDSFRKVLTVFLTITIAILCFFYLLNNMFSIGFGAWSTLNIAYENRQQPERQIREQRYDAGALGFGGGRVVEVRPFAGLFWQVSSVDTSMLDQTEWRRVDREADVKFP